MRLVTTVTLRYVPLKYYKLLGPPHKKGHCILVRLFYSKVLQLLCYKRFRSISNYGLRPPKYLEIRSILGVLRPKNSTVFK
ncbi:hypothetical protein KPB2_5584 [Klebsiella pneumoniae Kb677]|nr:hypothetical protein KPB2_5584 [Klebsiella pneumoniae Kb677]